MFNNQVHTEKLVFYTNHVPICYISK